MSRLVLALLAVLFCFAVEAVQLPLIEHGQAAGLANLAVNALTQDANGFIWIGTDNGLYRKDARRIERIDTATRILGIYSLTVDGKVVWIGAANGLWIWSGTDLRPVLASGRPLVVDQPQAIQVSHGITRVVSGGRLYEVRVRDGDGGWTATKVSLADVGGGDGKEPWITSVAGERDDLLFGCGASICRLRHGNLEHYGFAQGVPDDAWHYLLRASDGSVWARGGRYVLQLPAGGDRFVVRLRTDPDPVRLYPLVEDGQERILTAWREGVLRWDGHVWERFGRDSGLPSANRIPTMLVDAAQVLWLGMMGVGLLECRGYVSWENWSTADGLPHNAAWSFLRTPYGRDGRLYVGTGAGVATWDDARRRFSKIAGTSGMETFTLAPYAEGGAWAAGTAGALVPLDRPRAVSAVPQVGHEQIITLLLADHDGSVWIVTTDRLYRWRSGTLKARLEPVEVPPGKEELFTDACLDTSGALWLASSSGVHRLAAGHWQLLDSKEIGRAALACLADGTVMVASEYHGLYVVAGEGESLTLRDVTPASLLGKQLLAILQDSRGWLWLGTDSGIVVSNGRYWRHLDTASGLVWNDLSGRALYEDHDRSIWVGTSRGVSHLNRPEVLFAGKLQPPLVLSVRHAGQDMQGEAVVLPSIHDSLSVRFALPAVGAQQWQTLEFRVLGMDERWNETATGTVALSLLPPGSYRLEARTADKELGQYSEAVGIAIEVETPWWQTATARFAGAILIALLAYVLHRWHIRSLARRERVLEDLVGVRTRELERSHEQLRELAMRDPLTGVWNRRALMGALERELPRAKREAKPLAVVLADIDHFKAVNDVHGHPAGDAVLREFAARLQAGVRPYDVVGRYGGEEFLLLLPDFDVADEHHLARLTALHRLIADRPMSIGTVTCSFGVAGFAPADPMDADALIAKADAALYLAKRNGRNRMEMA